MRKLLLLVSAVVLVDTSFYAAITPLLPDLTEEFGLSKTGAGVLAAAYPIGTFVGGLPGGWMAGRVGVRPTVLTGLALMVISSVAVAFASSILVLDLARFCQSEAGCTPHQRISRVQASPVSRSKPLNFGLSSWEAGAGCM